MPLTNVLIGLSNFSLASGAACGASVVALSAMISAPQMMAHLGGRLVTMIVNPNSGTPIHVEHRVLLSGSDGSSHVLPLALNMNSNVQTFGGSAFHPNTLLVLLSGESIAMPVPQGAVGTAIQVVVMAACALSATVNVSTGLAALWQL